MKLRLRLLTALLIVIGSSCVAFGQSPDTPPGYKQIQTPVCPAFMVLGKGESTISHTDNPADVALSLAGLLKHLDSLPKNYALALAPYWLFAHPHESWRTDTARDVLQSIMKTFTLSAAIVDGGDTAHPSSNIGWGIQFSLISGQMAASSIDLLTKDEALLDKASAAFVAKRNALTTDELAAQQLAIHNRDSARAAGASKEEYAVYLNDLFAANRSLNEARIKAAATMQADSLTYSYAPDIVGPVRTGVVFDGALAFAYKAPRSIADSITFDRWNAWINFGYETEQMTYLLMYRHVGNQDTAIVGNYNDFGAKMTYQAKDVAASVEFLVRGAAGRKASNVDMQFRSAFVLDYHLLTEAWLHFTLGKDFASAQPNSIFAAAGISLDLSQKRLKM